MARIIQDSDDESDNDLEVDVHQTTANASPKHSTSDASSTEALRMQIEAAHRAHLQSQFPVYDRHATGIVQIHHDRSPKGTDTQMDACLKETSQGPSATEAANVNEVFGSFPNVQPQCQNSIGQRHHIAVPTAETGCTMGSMLREAYAQHNPNIMFPEPSSTVPNATLTQQRMMEVVQAPTLLGSDLENSEPPYEPNASIPWSDYLKSPTTTVEHSSIREKDVIPKEPAPSPEGCSNTHSKLSRLQQGRQGSLTPTSCSSAQDDPQTVVDGQDGILAPEHLVVLNAAQPQLSIASPISVEKAVHDKPAKSHQTRHNKRKSSSPGSISDDDLADLRMPKEQYKPRPSRSRSLKVITQESTDYSIVPERAKKTRKRVKSTPAATSLSDPMSTPNRVRQICEMGFTPSTSARALQQNRGNVTQSVDWLITNKVADDELVSQTPQMFEVSRSRIDTPEHEAGFQRNEDDAYNQANKNADAIGVTPGSPTTTRNAYTVDLLGVKSLSKVQVIIPAKSPNTEHTTSKTTVKCRKATPDPASTSIPENAEATKTEPKRGRGRPKKLPKAPATVSFDDEKGAILMKQQRGAEGHGAADAQLNTSSKQNRDGREMAEADAASTGHNLKHSQANHVASTDTMRPSMPEPPVPPPRPDVEPFTPEPAKKAPGSGAKMTYRVGLSRRARIAPLLRTMKKQV